METIAYKGEILSRWRVGNSTFLALPSRGARLLNWNVALGDGSVRDVVYWPEDADFSTIAKVRGGNPILFPFCGRTFDRGEQNFWRGPDATRRPMPQHGFARQGEFKTLWADARGFSAQLLPTAEDRAAFPYDYEFTVTYLFEPLGLACELALANLGREPIPWCAGHHFYFTVPWTEGARREDYIIRLRANERLGQDAAGQLVPAPPLQSEENLGNPALVDTIHTRLAGSEVAFGEKNRSGKVTVRLGTDKIPPPDAAFVTWSPDRTSPFYCVEPWMGPPNAPEHQRGLQWVPPRETARFGVSVLIK